MKDNMNQNDTRKFRTTEAAEAEYIRLAHILIPLDKTQTGIISEEAKALREEMRLAMMAITRDGEARVDVAVRAIEREFDWRIALLNLASRVRRHLRHEPLDASALYFGPEGLCVVAILGGGVVASKSDLLVELGSSNDLHERECDGFYRGLVVAGLTIARLLAIAAEAQP